MKKINIAIDGFSGCGKSSTAKELAKRLGYRFIDSGAMYRAVVLYFIQHEVALENADRVSEALQAIHIDFKRNEETGENETFLNQQNVEGEIRKMYVSAMVSPVAAIKAVRLAMVTRQQEMGKAGGVVMDGRDIGSVVLPGAELKVFMKAGDEARARRRQKELADKGEAVSLDEIIGNFRERDTLDTSRKESPLVEVPEAIVIDTSDLEFEEQVQKILALAKEVLSFTACCGTGKC